MGGIPVIILLATACRGLLLAGGKCAFKPRHVITSGRTRKAQQGFHLGG